MEQKMSIKELQKRAVGLAIVAIVCASILAVFVCSVRYGVRISDDAWVYGSVMLCIVPGGACLCLSCGCGYGSLQTWWMVRQIKRGVDVDKQSQVLLMQGVRYACGTVISFVAAVVVLVWVFNASEFKELEFYVLVFTAVPGILAFFFGREVLKIFREVGRLEEIEGRAKVNSERSGLNHGG